MLDNDSVFLIKYYKLPACREREEFMAKLVKVTEVFSCLGNNSRSLAGVNDFPPDFC
jgi:hypothetical protein